MVSSNTPLALRLAVFNPFRAPHSPEQKTPHKAGVVGDGCLVLAVDTLVLVSAQSRSAATLDSSKCLQHLIADTGLEAFQKRLAPGADDVGHFHGRPGHGRRGR